MRYKIHYYHFFVQIILDLATGSSFEEIPVFFLTHSYHSLHTFLLSDIFLKEISVQWASSFHKGICDSNVSVLSLCLPPMGTSGEYWRKDSFLTSAPSDLFFRCSYL